MKLNKDQIQQVEDHLSQKGLKYVDIRYEVLDHMITDIEHLMESTDLSFSYASENVFAKWNKNFVTRSSLWIGSGFSGPKIFIDNSVPLYKKMVMKIQYIAFAVTIGLGTIFNHFKILWSDYSQEITLIFKTTAVISLTILLYWFYQIKKTKLQSSYSFLFTRSILLGSLTFGILSLTLFKEKLFIYAFIIFGLWSGWLLYKNHMKSISLYSSISSS